MKVVSGDDVDHVFVISVASDDFILKSLFSCCMEYNLLLVCDTLGFLGSNHLIECILQRSEWVDTPIVSPAKVHWRIDISKELNSSCHSQLLRDWIELRWMERGNPWASSNAIYFRASVAHQLDQKCRHYISDSDSVRIEWSNIFLFRIQFLDLCIILTDFFSNT